MPNKKKDLDNTENNPFTSDNPNKPFTARDPRTAKAKAKAASKAAVKTARELTKREKAPKPITMWAIVDNEYPDDPISFTATRSDAIIALDQYLYLKHYKHFRLWCPLHGHEVDHSTAWAEYSRTAMNLNAPEGPLYTVVKIEYDPNTIASLLRHVNACTPLGCAFETPEELDEYSAYLARKSEAVARGDDHFTPIEEALDLLFDDLEAKGCDVCDNVDCPSSPTHVSPEDIPSDSSNSCPHDHKYDA